MAYKRLVVTFNIAKKEKKTIEKCVRLQWRTLFKANTHILQLISHTHTLTIADDDDNNNDENSN